MDQALAAEGSSNKHSGQRRLLVWRGLDEWRSEAASVHLTSRGIEATGTQMGFDPLVYRLDYELEATHDFITKRLLLHAAGTGWSRHVHLRHDGRGKWSVEADSIGGVHLPSPGGDPASIEGALDCDLGFSPLTNLMPIRRTGLDKRVGAQDFLMAWVSAPDLSVVASGQRYEHVRRTDRGSVVRYVDRGLFPGFKADLRLDHEGFVMCYPGLAARVEPKRTSLDVDF